MATHDLTALYSAKAVEYLIAVSYLLLFVPFWKFVNGGRSARERVPVRLATAARMFNDLFELPERLFFHPGHAWARVDGDDMVTIGIDDFARKLVGPVAGIRLPRQGDTLSQGERGWSLDAGARSIDMLSPVDGTVVAVNEQAAASPALVHEDPYERGWLLKVRSPRLAANAKHLFSGQLARSWMNGVSDALRLQAASDLGLAYEDGGLPVDGLARSLDPERWDEIARRFLLTAEGGPDA